jgi:serine-type D-Ala-D-Ala carboxypeptidase/endopeptidase (penicillin-binding protein 4)
LVAKSPVSAAPTVRARPLNATCSRGGSVSADAAIRDGSGLSRHDYLTPRAVVRLLTIMQQHPTFELFFAALPIAGVDGTIGSRMRGTPAQGNLRAKTGTLDKARSLSGYVTTSDGHQLVFSMLCNNWTGSVRDVERVQDAIGAYLASVKMSDMRWAMP